MAVVLTNGGRAVTVQRVMGSGAEPKYLGVGTGAGSAAVGNTSLFSEVAADLTTGTGVRFTGTSAAYSTNVSGDTYGVTAVCTATGVGSITNIGLWDAATIGSGNLFTHADFPVPLGLGIGDEATFEFFVAYG